MSERIDGIDYENIDVSNQAFVSRVKEVANLPGETVFYDADKRVSGHDEAAQETFLEKLGSEPLTISRAIAVGEGAFFVLSYEFEGVEGRWPAVHFSEDLRIDQSYGVTVVRDGRGYFVHLEIDGEDPKATGKVFPLVAGSTRWSKDFRGGPETDDEERLSAILRNPVAGELVLAPKDDGWFVYVEVWHSSASEREIEVAGAAVDAFLSPAHHTTPVEQFRSRGYVGPRP